MMRRRGARSPWSRSGRRTGAALCTWLLAAAPAGGALLVHEPFGYDAGSALDDTPATGTNLSGSYTALGSLPQQKLQAAAPGLTYGSLVGAPPVAGNRLTDVAGVTAAGATVGLDQPVTAAPGEAVFWSALLTLDDSSNANHLARVLFMDDDTGDQIAFGEPVVGSGGIRVESTRAGMATRAAGADDAFADGDTLLLVGRYVNGVVADGDSLELLVYDTADADVLPLFFDPSDPGAEHSFALTGVTIDLAQITSIHFAIRGNDNNFIDELRIGSSYGAVVPEPGSGALLLAGLAALARGARRRPGSV